MMQSGVTNGILEAIWRFIATVLRHDFRLKVLSIHLVTGLDATDIGLLQALPDSQFIERLKLDFCMTEIFGSCASMKLDDVQLLVVCPCQIRILHLPCIMLRILKALGWF